MIKFWTFKVEKERLSWTQMLYIYRMVTLFDINFILKMYSFSTNYFEYQFNFILSLYKNIYFFYILITQIERKHQYNIAWINWLLVRIVSFHNSFKHQSNRICSRIWLSKMSVRCVGRAARFSAHFNCSICTATCCLYMTKRKESKRT